MTDVLRKEAKKLEIKIISMEVEYNNTNDEIVRLRSRNGDLQRRIGDKKRFHTALSDLLNSSEDKKKTVPPSTSEPVFDYTKVAELLFPVSYKTPKQIFVGLGKRVPLHVIETTLMELELPHYIERRGKGVRLALPSNIRKGGVSSYFLGGMAVMMGSDKEYGWRKNTEMMKRIVERMVGSQNRFINYMHIHKSVQTKVNALLVNSPTEHVRVGHNLVFKKSGSNLLVKLG